MSDYETLRREIADLRAEVATLRAERPARAAAPAPDAEAPEVSRRALFGKLAGAAVAGAGLAALAAEPAAAAVGGSFILGAGNDSVGEGSSLHNVSAETTLDVYNGGTGSAMMVDTTSTTGSAPALLVRTNNLGPCIDAAHLNGDNGSPVIEATATGGTAVHGTGYVGVLGETTGGQGVYGYSESGRAVYGYSGSGTALYGYSNGDYGVRAYGALAPMMLEPAAGAGKPTSGTHVKGEVYVDANGAIWQCVAGGTPGTWAKPGFNPTSPVRVVGGVSVGAGLTTSATVVGVAGIPAAAKAVALAVNATANAATYLTVYATGTARPALANVHVAPQYVWGATTLAPIGTGGKVTIYNKAGTAKVYVYLLGWFL